MGFLKQLSVDASDNLDIIMLLWIKEIENTEEKEIKHLQLSLKYHKEILDSLNKV
jgi:hypothetical protein